MIISSGCCRAAGSRYTLLAPRYKRSLGYKDSGEFLNAIAREGLDLK
jgi:hypothetical protein